MRHARGLIAVLSVMAFLGGCGSESADEAKGSAASSEASPTEQSPKPSPSASPSPTPSTTPSPTPTEEPEPPAPSLGDRDDVQDAVDDLVEADIEWEEAPTPKGRERLLGLVDGTAATIELFGPEDGINEVSYQVVFDGTSQDVNFDRALPMILLAQEFASEKAAMFVGSRLDSFTRSPQMPATNRTQKFGNTFVRVLSIDLVGAVNLTISTGKPPTKP